ncbi:MAG: FmdB family transcriptional regulator [Opitutae bacterium]
MPFFKYQVLNQCDPPEYIEIEQLVNDSPLVKHPLTGEPIRRVVTAPSLTLNHSSSKEKKILSADHLQKHGFSVLQKDTISQQYIPTTGPKNKIDHSRD